MKSAKEWAAEVVSTPEHRLGKWRAWMTDEKDSVPLQEQAFEQNADEMAVDARAIIERLVERVQADAREPLLALLREVGDELRHLSRHAPAGSTAEDICERLLPKIEEALG